jgi:hypothetical protein
MDQVLGWLQYVRENPHMVVGAALGLAILYALLNYKSKLTRDAERRVAELRKGREDYYRKVRPLG